MEIKPISRHPTHPSLNELLHYSKIFKNNINKNTDKSTDKSTDKLTDKSIIYLKKKEFDIFYSTKYKYPLLVAETITRLTGETDPNHPPIDRRIIEDSFRPDNEISLQHQYNENDYMAYMEYGGSMGHNAPAGQHKTNLEVYHETFLFTNITPQEMVFNSGLWVLMENWCKNLGKNNKISRIMVFTGSIPEYHNHDFNGTSMNVPIKMFKIICLQFHETPDLTCMEILIANNTPYNINYNLAKFDLSSFLIPTNSYKYFYNNSKINIKNLLDYYGFNSINVKPFKNYISMEIMINKSLKLLLNKSRWFGNLIYAPSLSILENRWNECQKLEKYFQNISFHKEFYELAKKRLMRENNSISIISSLKYSLPNKSISKSRHKSNRKSKKSKKTK